jgi:hypothetical protein
MEIIWETMERLERERDDARELLASEKATRNAIIAKGIETERQLAEARAICEELVTDSNAVTLAATVVRLERERDEALHKLEIAMAANSDVERIAKERNDAQKAFAIATDQLVQVQGELRQAREENARLREALEKSKEFVQSWGELIDTQYPLWNECMTTIQKALTP